MYINKWLKENTTDLNHKLIAISGSSGDLGKAVCKRLVSLGADLLLINRNRQKSERLKEELLVINKGCNISIVIIDFENFDSVQKGIEELEKYNIDIFIANAASYKIERRISTLGYDNVFQINFVSHYYIIRKIIEKMEKGKIVIVSSIAANYSKINLSDIDFSKNRHCNKVYGNSKRFLMYSMYELLKEYKNIDLSVVHPGISYTNITSHYPKFIFHLIKYPMKLIFCKPKKASLSILKGVFEKCEYHEWIGPRLFNIWGYPHKRKVSYCSMEESKIIGEYAQEIYNKIKR